jgi:UDP-glucose 4-epimerase
VSLLGLIELIERILNLRMNYRFRQQRPGDQAVYVTNFSKFARHTGWMPETGIEQTVYDIFHWYKGNEDLFLPGRFSLPEEQVGSGIIREMAS